VRGENIVCFAKDWAEVPTSNHHVMIELAKNNRVLWLNSLATRTPKLGSSRDMGKIVQKLGEFGRGPVRMAHDLWVFTPLVLPFPHVEAARIVNRRILAATLAALRRRLGMKDFQLWTFLPNVADYLGSLGEALSVYYCVDEWSMFSYIDRDRMVAAERRLCTRADVIFAVCDALVASKRELNPETHLATHGVDHTLFASALDDKTRVPDDLAAIPRPRIGFYGTLQDWVDLPLIERLARRHPEWNIVLIGGIQVDVADLARLPNVHLLGRRPHGDLPRYCKGFDVGIVPYRGDERMRFVNPIKLREYLSAGLPVVTTSLPEARRYAPECLVADDPDAFEAAIVAALEKGDHPARLRRSAMMGAETWERKVAAVAATVMEVKDKKWRRQRAIA
jgi:glycosyltransferase involved in cell wall biosynthesis